jgi:3-oxoacyl-[acyl-carrier protein] reductase
MPDPLSSDRSKSAALHAAAIFGLDGEIALVTGASSGLGRRFAKVLAANGARVALAGLREPELLELVDEIAAMGGKATAVPFDLRDRDRIPEIFSQVEAALGPLTIVVNNAGISGESAVADLDYESWREILNVDLDALFLMSREAARRMSSSGGAIINVSSILGLRPMAGMAAYSVAKAGVAHLSRIMALELAGNGIRVNTLAPGYVVTGMNQDFFASEQSRPLIETIPMRRVGEVEDLDGALLLLASRASRFMTGATLVVDGGHILVL